MLVSKRVCFLGQLQPLTRAPCARGGGDALHLGQRQSGADRDPGRLRTASTIMDGIVKLIASHLYPVALLAFGASAMVPALKLAGLAVVR